MKKILLCLLSIFLLYGCASNQEAQIQLDTPVHISFFYIDTCPQCKDFKETAIPYLKKMFQDQVTIDQYDLDDKEKTQAAYDKVIDSLNEFDESQYGNGPFYSIDGYFAKLGYISGDEEELVKDIEKAVKNEELGYELEANRFIYKDMK